MSETPSKRRRRGRIDYEESNDCPYKSGSSEEGDWIDGWEEARQADIEAEQEESDAQELLEHVMCQVTDVRSLVEFLINRDIITY